MDTYLEDYVIPSFGSTLPVYFRVLVLVALGLWAWGSNLHLLTAAGIDVSALFGTVHDKSITHRGVYVMAFTFSAVTAASLCAFWKTVENRGNVKLPVVLCYAIIVAMVLIPINTFHRKERMRFLRALRRVFFGGLHQEVFFADVILADILTSFAKVFGDIYTSLSILFVAENVDVLASANGDSGGRLTQEHYHWMLVPLLVSVPYACRLRQCLSEFFQSNMMNSRHLGNAIKYFTALPVIFLSGLQKSTKAIPEKASQMLQSPGTSAEPAALPVEIVNWGTQTEEGVLWMWVMAVLINAGYSFYWDVCVDWDLGYRTGRQTGTGSAAVAGSAPVMTEISLATQRTSQKLGDAYCENGTVDADSTHRHRLRKHHTHSVFDAAPDFPLFLRPVLHFSSPVVYYLAVLVDLSLRFTWLLKLSDHFQIFETEGGVFIVELLEILRRWVWVYFRLEREWVSRGHSATRMKIELDQMTSPR